MQGSRIYIYADNQSVLANTTIYDLTLKKSSQSITYHMVHICVTKKSWDLLHQHHVNKANLLTKKLPSGEK